jgi:hypothetical protein
MVVIDSRDNKHTWVWMTEQETNRVRRGDWSYTIVRGMTDQGRHVLAELRDDEVIQAMIQGDQRGIMMHRHVAMLNGLHAG